MLQALMSTLSGGFEAALALALLIAYLQRTGRAESIAWAGKGIAVGALASLAAAGALQWFGGREIYEGTAFLIISLVEVALLIWLWTGSGTPRPRHEFGAGMLVLLGAMGMVLARGVDIVLFPTRLFIQTTEYLNTELLYKLFGGLLGVVFAVILGLILVRAAAILTPREIRRLAAAAWLSMVIRQAVVVVQVLLVYGVLPMNDTLLAVMIPLINHEAWFFNWLLSVAAILVLWAGVRRSSREIPADGLNRAQLRKLKAAGRRDVRLVSLSGLLIGLVASLLLTSNLYANREVELSPAKPVTVVNSGAPTPEAEVAVNSEEPTPVDGAAVNGEVQIPVDEVNDGQLHRYSYAATDGTEVRFIVIQKGGSSFGVALDACEICGPVGFYQRKDQVVCKACDTVINPATIGFEGGCNPIPLEFRLDGGNLVIPVEKLENEKERF